VKHSCHAQARKVGVPALGIEVTPLTLEDVLACLRSVRPQALLVGHNLHSVYMSHTDPEFSATYRRATVILIDGQPVRWIANRDAPRADRLPASVRVGSMDWLTLAGEAWNVSRLAVVGASAESNARTVDTLRDRKSVV